MKIAILDGHMLNPGDCDWSPIAQIGSTSIYPTTSLDEMEIRTKDVDVLVLNKIPLRGEFFKKMGKKVRCICILATGYDNIDLSACNKRGIPVCNVTAYGVDDVAQHTMALILEMNRQISAHVKSVLAGEWTERNQWCYWLKAPINLRGRTLGIIGFGAIGRKVGELAHAFGMNVLANCRTPRNPPSYVPFSFASKEQIFAQSDIISLHCPLSTETREIIQAKNIAKMKDGVQIVNLARGSLLHDQDCAAALRSGKISFLATDVLSCEPPQADHPLLSAPHILITPHMAWASVQSRQRIISMTAENIQRWMKGTAINVVNKPKILSKDSPKDVQNAD